MQDRSFYCGYPELDFDIMNKAASMLVGTHCFSCFEKAGSDNKTSDCTVFEAYWKAYEPTHAALMGFGKEESVGTAPYWYFRISADRFLRNMVRAVVGTLLEVGRGKRSLEDFASLILPPTGSPTVPPFVSPSISHSTAPSVSPASPSVFQTGFQTGFQTDPAAGPATAPDRNQVPPRCRAGESVPGYALFLSQIKY